MVDQPNRETILRRKLNQYIDLYDYIIIDCPPSLQLLTVNALTAGRKLLIPLQAEYYALEGLSDLLNTYGFIKRNFNPELEIMGIILTMFDPRNRLSHQVASDVRDHFPDLVFKTIIPRNVRLSESPSHGQPIIIYDIKSSGANAYLSFTKEVLNGTI